MDRDATLLLVEASALLVAASLLGLWWRRRHPLGALALVPWAGLLFVGVATFAVGMSHLATLAGVPLPRRY
jgi:hypothetical protein